MHWIFNMHTSVNACDCIQCCVNTLRESALKVQSGRNIPCCTAELNQLHQQHAGPDAQPAEPCPYLPKSPLNIPGLYNNNNKSIFKAQNLVLETILSTHTHTEAPTHTSIVKIIHKTHVLFSQVNYSWTQCSPPPPNPPKVTSLPPKQILLNYSVE